MYQRLKYSLLIIPILLGRIAITHGQALNPQAIRGASLSGTYLHDPVGDTVTLTIWKNVFSLDKKDLTPSREYRIAIRNRKFSFRIDSLSKENYATLGIGKFMNGKPYRFLDLFVIEPGDDINISITENRRIDERDKIVYKNENARTCLNCEDFNFSGSGSLKFKARQELYLSKDSLQIKWWETEPVAQKEPRSFTDIYHRSYSQMDFVKKRTLTILQKYAKKIPFDTYQLLRADALGRCNFLFLQDLASSYEPDQVDQSDKKRFRKFYIERIQKRVSDHIPEPILAFSAYYPPTLIFKARLESKLFLKKNTFIRLKENYSGDLRDRLLSNYLFDNLHRNGADSLTLDALNIIQNANYRKSLAKALSDSRVGTDLNFSLKDLNGKTVSLNDFRGKIVFVDFWFYGCAGCSSFYQEKLSNIEERYQKDTRIVFLTISIDRDRKTWEKALNSGKYTSKSAINLNIGEDGEEHLLIKKLNINSYPTLIIVDKNGRIACNDTALLRDQPESVISRVLAAN